MGIPIYAIGRDATAQRAEAHSFHHLTLDANVLTDALFEQEIPTKVKIIVGKKLLRQLQGKA